MQPYAFLNRIFASNWWFTVSRLFLCCVKYYLWMWLYAFKYSEFHTLLEWYTFATSIIISCDTILIVIVFWAHTHTRVYIYKIIHTTFVWWQPTSLLFMHYKWLDRKVIQTQLCISTSLNQQRRSPCSGCGGLQIDNTRYASVLCMNHRFLLRPSYVLRLTDFIPLNWGQSNWSSS